MVEGHVYDSEGHEIPAAFLRDTGSLQSICDRILLPDWSVFNTGEYRVMKGVTGKEVKLPLVQLQMKSRFANGEFLVCLSDELPSGINLLIGNDIRSDTSLVVTRSMAATKSTLKLIQIFYNHWLAILMITTSRLLNKITVMLIQM